MTAEDLSGRRALVTGGGAGIGAAIARELASRGATVLVADLDAEAAVAVADEVGGEAWVVDLSDRDQVESDGFAARVAGTDILVNNAGVQRIAAIEDFDPEAFRFILRLMVEAPFLLVRAALPGMYERGFGRIVNISSVHGLRASPYKSAYVIAKHGLEGLSKATALEGGDRGVTSNCVNPGYVRTALVEKQVADQAARHGIDESEVLDRVFLTESAVKRLVEPEEVASLVGWLTTDAAAMVTGASYTMDGGWSAR
ncbi:3-hydroxybutyrate dehydrogenase [Microbacterium sp. 1P10UB]|uniref:3-hydroxybutyrate dehydrogenase n=1 Tax=unclassified Microbacterium TaxID=2609290 RepID=UPI0039A24925